MHRAGPASNSTYCRKCKTLYETFMKHLKFRRKYFYDYTFFFFLLYVLNSCNQYEKEFTDSEISSLKQNGVDSTYFILTLRSKFDTTRSIYMNLGRKEAKALLPGLQNLKPNYSLPVDLSRKIFTKFKFDITSVQIDGLKNEVFTSKVIGKRGSESVEIDADTIDALMVATKIKCPIYIEKRLFQLFGK